MGASPFAAIGRGYYDGAGPDAPSAQPQRRRPEPASMGPTRLGAPKPVGQQQSFSSAPQRPAYGTPRVASGQARPMMQPPRQRPMYGGGGYGQAQGRMAMQRQSAPPYMGPQQQGMAPPPEPPPQFQPPSLAGMEMGRGPEMMDDSGYQDDLQADRLRRMLAQRQRGGYY